MEKLMKTNRLPSRRIAAGLLLLALAAGCSSVPTYRGFFEEHQSQFPVTDRGLLLETLRVIVLLEDYRRALEARDIDALLDCYSPRYSHYEHGLDWCRRRIEESYFEPFAELEARFGPLTVEFVRKYSGHWMRQEDFDWLRSRGSERIPDRSYRITLPSTDGPVELLLAGPPGGERVSPRPVGVRQDPESPAEPLPVTVSSLVDPAVERPLGEVSFPVTIRGRLKAAGTSGDFVSTLRERAVFLLEKEDGRWRIISQF